MNTKTLFKKYYRRVARQGMLKALLLSATIGLVANFIIAFILWFTDIGLFTVLLVTLLTFAVVTIAMVPVTYFKLFRPTTSRIAYLIDRLGLEERMITMCEMEKDESYIAMLQREDAKARLKNVRHRDVKLKFSRVAVVMFAVAFLFGMSMTTVSALAATGNVRGGNEVFDPPHKGDEEQEDSEYVTITYLAGEGGIIEGDTRQKIKKGGDAEPVTATPLKGYVFVVWSDQIMTPQRWDWSVTEDMIVEAQFEPAPEGSGDGDTGDSGDQGDNGNGESDDGEDGEDGEDGGENSGDDDGESKGESNGEDGEGDPQGPGEGDGANGSGETPENGNNGDPNGSGGDKGGSNDGAGPDRDETYHPGNSAGPGASAGHNSDNNNIVDGKTDYHDVVDPEKSKEDLSGDDSIPPELKDILDGYFDSLTP